LALGNNIMQQKIKALSNLKNKINLEMNNYNKIRKLSLEIENLYPEADYNNLIKDKSDFWVFFDNTLDETEISKKEMNNIIMDHFNFLRAKEEINILETEMVRLIKYRINLIESIDLVIGKIDIPNRKVNFYYIKHLF
jgi:hypothetical protein